MANAVLVLPLFILFVAGVFLLLSRRSFRKKAERDYRRARGTHHKKQIELALVSIKNQITRLKSEEAERQDEIIQNRSNEEKELDAALSKHLVNTKLREVPGLGQSRISSIQTSVFRGRLSDLHQAHVVPGIGQAIQTSISNWVRSMESTWGRSRSTDFPGKKAIVERHSLERQKIEIKQHEIAKRIAELEGHEGAATGILQSLLWASPSDFRTAMKKGASYEKPELLRQYILGVFAPWEKIPSTYAEVIEAAEGTSYFGSNS